MRGLTNDQSKTRTKIPGGDIPNKTSGKNAFRFLIPRQAALDDPLTAQYAKRDGQLIIWYGQDRRVIMYPCDANRQLNFVCIHPREESDVDGASGKWTSAQEPERHGLTNLRLGCRDHQECTVGGVQEL